MKKLQGNIIIAIILLVGLTLGNAYAQEEPAPTVVGNKYATTIKAGGDNFFVTLAFSPTGVMTIAGFNGAGSYWATGQIFAGIFNGVDVKLPNFVGDVVMLFVGAAASKNSVVGVGYVIEERTKNYYYSNFPFFFSGKF
ncbi:MAG: hypothetical protein WCQ99_01095 [Pseudomonadota bacterium]